MEMLHQTRLANPRLADDQYRLTLTLERAFPAIQQEPQFVAPDERGQSMRRRDRFEPAMHSTRSDYPVELNRPLDSLELLGAAIFNYKLPRDQPMSIGCY